MVDTNSVVIRRMTFKKGNPGGDLFEFLQWVLQSTHPISARLKTRLREMHSSFNLVERTVAECDKYDGTCPTFPAKAGEARTWATQELTARSFGTSR